MSQSFSKLINTDTDTKYLLQKQKTNYKKNFFFFSKLILMINNITADVVS